MSEIEKRTRDVKLFFCIPIYDWKAYGSKKTWKILGIPVLKRKFKVGEMDVTYSFFGVPVITIKKVLK